MRHLLAASLVFAAIALCWPATSPASPASPLPTRCATLIDENIWDITPQHTACRRAIVIVRRLVHGGHPPRGWRCLGNPTRGTKIACRSKHHHEFTASHGIRYD